ncbi:MAG: cob(I)yrinic acid a,c-diamide adenosyltransferase [Thermoplasmata archaeon]
MAAGGERIPRLYTRTGDRGTTGLAGGVRLAKDALRIRAYGAYDELGAHLGVALATLPESLGEIRTVVRRLQDEVFVAQAELAAAPNGAGAKHHLTAAHTERLEHEIDRFEAEHPPTRSFVVPGGSMPASALHVCRTISRRAERELFALHRDEPLSADLLAWANRLSDLLFALALATNHALGVVETPPNYTV